MDTIIVTCVAVLSVFAMKSMQTKHVELEQQVYAQGMSMNLRLAAHEKKIRELEEKLKEPIKVQHCDDYYEKAFEYLDT